MTALAVTRGKEKSDLNKTPLEGVQQQNPYISHPQMKESTPITPFMWWFVFDYEKKTSGILSKKGQILAMEKRMRAKTLMNSRRYIPSD